MHRPNGAAAGVALTIGNGLAIRRCREGCNGRRAAGLPCQDGAGTTAHILQSARSAITGHPSVKHTPAHSSLLRNQPSATFVRRAGKNRTFRSRNTHENALFTKQLLLTHPQWDTLVLVTSAFHERRALGCFEKVGLHPIAFPAGFRTTDRRITPDYWLQPDVGALERWGLLLHEITGWLTYKLMGYC